MSDSFTANLITGAFLIFTILLVISLAEKLPADFMNQNYTGETIKPILAAQIAYLTIAGTVIFMFFVWIVTPLISHYYDYLLANLLVILGIWWLGILIMAGIVKQIQPAGLQWALATTFVATIGFIFGASLINSFALGFLATPIPLHGTVIEKDASTSKYGANFTVKIDENSYKVTRNAYSEITIGQTVEVLHTTFRNMIFPTQHVKLTWVGVVLLILNSLSILGAIVVTGYSSIKEDKQGLIY